MVETNTQRFGHGNHSSAKFNIFPIARTNLAVNEVMPLIKELAEKESRSINNMTYVLLKEALTARGLKVR